jgi:flagellar motility protein MotE (MotC chaperone)
MLTLFKDPKKFAALIAFKVIVAGVIFSAFQGWIHIGDLSLTAAVKDEKTADAPKAAEETKTEGEAKTTEVALKEQPTRKSFLSNLLELPSLDTETAKKEEIATYMNIIERKQKQVEDRLSMLTNREGQLKKLEGSIDEKLKRLDDERRFFAQTIQKEKELKGERIEKLVSLYAKMEPKKAAPVFEKLDRDLVVELFKQLPQKQVTLVLEGMSADKSVSLSEYYGRVRSAKEYDLLKEMNTSLRSEFDQCKGMPSDEKVTEAAGEKK